MWRKLINLLRDEYGYSASQARGVIALFGLIIIILLIPAAWSLIKPKLVYHKSEKKLIEGDREALEAFFKESGAYKSGKPDNFRKEKEQKKFYPFNPNRDSRDALVNAGLPTYLAEGILKYREKGGKFKKADDLGKLYGMSPGLFAQLKPFIRLETPDTVSAKPELKSAKAMPAKPIPLVNLNMADTILLESLRGIGAKTASRIVRYRDRLGGFHNLNQLKEIFGIDSTMFSAITIQCEVDTVTSSIRKIPMAEVELDALSLHPYISRRQAGILLAWRRQRGIKNGNDLILSKALSPEEAKRLEPYLIF